GCEQQVWVVPLKQGLQVDEERALVFDGQAAGDEAWEGELLFGFYSYSQIFGRGVVGRGIRFNGEDPQRSRFLFQVPGLLCDLVLYQSRFSTGRELAGRQGKGAVPGGVAQWRRQVGVIVGQIGKGSRGVLEKLLLEGRILHRTSQHRHRFFREE